MYCVLCTVYVQPPSLLSFYLTVCRPPSVSLNLLCFLSPPPSTHLKTDFLLNSPSRRIIVLIWSNLFSLITSLILKSPSPSLSPFFSLPHSHSPSLPQHLFSLGVVIRQIQHTAALTSVAFQSLMNMNHLLWATHRHA